MALKDDRDRNHPTQGGKAKKYSLTNKVEPNDYAMRMNWKWTILYEEILCGINLGILENFKLWPWLT